MSLNNWEPPNTWEALQPLVLVTNTTASISEVSQPTVLLVVRVDLSPTTTGSVASSVTPTISESAVVVPPLNVRSFTIGYNQ